MIIMDDITLIKLIASEESGALSTLYDRYKNLVFSLAANIIGDHETAEEITLDVFMQVWKKADTYVPEIATVKRWLVSITRNRSIDMLRRRKIRFDSHTPQWSPVSSDTLSTGDNMEQAIELSMMRKKISAAVRGLPEEQREVLALAYFKGFTHQQIAEILNSPLGTIKTRIRLGMQKLRELLTAENYFD